MFTRPLSPLAFALGFCSVVAYGAPTEIKPYIVVLKPGGAPPAEQAATLLRNQNAQRGFVYEHALRGFSMTASSQAAEAIARNPNVAYMELDLVQHISAQEVPTGIQRILANSNRTIAIDGTDERVDVDVAVIDTGIDWEHPDLNVVAGINCAQGNFRTAICSGNGDDDHYHGTHVAGTIGALDNDFGLVGVAPGARLHAVKVLDSSGSGYTSFIVAGIDYVAAHADEIEVANMSLGGLGFSQAEYDAIQGAVNQGVAFAVAAGNEDADAQDYSPASFDNVLTVSALADFDGASGGDGAPTCRTDQDDTLADFSNYGSAVDIAAPGVCITSAYPLEKGSYGTISGTSMASPHAAGGLALLASKNKPTNSNEVYALYEQLKSLGTTDDWTDDSGDGNKEPLLKVDSIAAAMVSTEEPADVPDANTSPVASFTVECENLSCSFVNNSSDNDGDMLTYDWAFGDGSTSTEVRPSHTYASSGDYTIELTVDDGQSTSSDSQTVNLVDPAAEPEAPTFTYTQASNRRWYFVTIVWDASGSVDIIRDGNTILAGSTAGSYQDKTSSAPGAYQVCLSGTGVCSDEKTVNW